MKMTLTLITSLLLTACGGSGNSTVTPTHDRDPVPKAPYKFSMLAQSMNLCGKTTQYTQYEVIAYQEDGNIVSRHLANSIGKVEATFEQSHINLVIIRDAGEDTTDKKDLDVTVLGRYPVGDLGVLTIRNKDTDDCACQITPVNVQPGRLTSSKINLPYTAGLFTSESNLFKDTQLCEIETGKEALLVVNNLNKDSGEISYLAISNPSQNKVDGTISINMDTLGQVGNEIVVNATDTANHGFHYVTDNIYDYYVPDKRDQMANILDHERVKKIKFHAYMQLDPAGFGIPVRGWGVQVPLTDDTIEINYRKPDFEPELLSTLLENPKNAYNLDGENQRVISGYLQRLRPDNSSDTWYFILPSQSDYGINIELPDDYQVGISDVIDYQDLPIQFPDWALNEIQTVKSLDEIYYSEWLKVLLPITSPVMVRPPAAYSYVEMHDTF